MIILEDTRQQANRHNEKHSFFERNGIEIKRTKLYVGDYSIQELIGDICGKSHERFRNELIRAQESHIKLIILVEDNGGYCDRKNTIYNKPVTCINDLFGWKNPRLFIWQGGKQKYPNATKGATLAKALLTMQEKYDCQFLFVKKENSGAKIVELLMESEV